VDGVAWTKPALGELIDVWPVLEERLAGQHADGLVLVPVVLQAQRVPGPHLDDLSRVQSVDGSEDELVSPRFVLPGSREDLGLRSGRSRAAATLRRSHRALLIT
jgi:hypothetical protein